MLSRIGMTLSKEYLDLSARDPQHGKYRESIELGKHSGNQGLILKALPDLTHTNTSNPDKNIIGPRATGHGITGRGVPS